MDSDDDDDFIPELPEIDEVAERELDGQREVEQQRGRRRRPAATAEQREAERQRSHQRRRLEETPEQREVHKFPLSKVPKLSDYS